MNDNDNDNDNNNKSGDVVYRQQYQLDETISIYVEFIDKKETSSDLR